MSSKQPLSPYPVIDADPTFGRVVRYMRPSDYAAWAGAAAAGPAAFWALGKLRSGLGRWRGRAGRETMGAVELRDFVMRSRWDRDLVASSRWKTRTAHRLPSYPALPFICVYEK